MKILFYRYGSICEPDILMTFMEYGFEVTEIIEEIHNKDFSPKEGVTLVSETLLETPHDCVFSVNFYPFLAEVCNIMKIRYLCWVVDSPVIELYSTSVRHPWNRIFLFDRTLYREISPLNPDCVFYLPLAVNAAQKQRAIAQASENKRARFRSDLSFVGSLYTEKNPYAQIRDLPQRLLGYLDGLMEAQLLVYGYYFIDDVLTDSHIQTIRQHAADFPDLPFGSGQTDRALISQLYIGSQITSMERTRMLSALSGKFAVDLYTGSDTSALPHVCARGRVKTQTEMPLIFHESRINLNMTAKSIRSALPLRIWDILGCGGFCLTNYQTEIEEYFAVGEEIETYTSRDELLDKCAYYLEHENLRREIAANAYEKVIQKHTYLIRLGTLMELAFAKN